MAPTTITITNTTWTKSRPRRLQALPRLGTSKAPHQCPHRPAWPRIYQVATTITTITITVAPVPPSRMLGLYRPLGVRLL